MNRLRFISALLLGACLVHAQRGDEREVLFAPGAAQFNPDQRVLLDAVDELVRNRADRALLTYRSGFGIPEELALERARAVRQFLIDHGVREDRIRLRSEDPGNPVDTNAPRGVGLRLTYYTAAAKASQTADDDALCFVIPVGDGSADSGTGQSAGQLALFQGFAGGKACDQWQDQKKFIHVLPRSFPAEFCPHRIVKRSKQDLVA